MNAEDIRCARCSWHGSENRDITLSPGRTCPERGCGGILVRTHSEHGKARTDAPWPPDALSWRQRQERKRVQFSGGSA